MGKYGVSQVIYERMEQKHINGVLVHTITNEVVDRTPTLMTRNGLVEIISRGGIVVSLDRLLKEGARIHLVERGKVTFISTNPNETVSDNLDHLPSSIM